MKSYIFRSGRVSPILLDNTTKYVEGFENVFWHVRGFILLFRFPYNSTYLCFFLFLIILFQCFSILSPVLRHDFIQALDSPNATGAVRCA